MGRGSDTRIYAPRSESSTMYSSANEDETRYGPPSSYDKEKRMDEKKEKEESRKTKLKDIKHIKIKPSQGLLAGSQLETEPGLDDGNKRDDEREMGLQGGPAGSRGTLLDLATGAKSGTGSSMGSIMASEPMADAWSELLKGRELQDFLEEYPDIKFQTNEVWDSPFSDEPLEYGNTTHGKTSHLNVIGDNARSRTMNPQRMAILQRLSDRGRGKPTIVQQIHGNVEDPYFVPPGMKNPPLEREGPVSPYHNEDFYNSLDYEGPISQEMLDEHVRRYDLQTGEPMDNAWSELLKEIPIGYSAVGPSSRCDNTKEGCDGTYEAHYRGPEDNPKELVDIFCPKCGRYHEITGDEYDRYLQTDMARGEHPSQQNIQTGEPMDNAWSELLKEIPIGYSAVGPSSRCDNTKEGCDGTYEAHYRGPEDNPKELVDIFCPKCGRYHEITGDEYDRYLQTDMARGEHPSQQNIQTGEPMDGAWSELLKEEDGPHTFNINEVLNNPKESWYQSVMGTDTPLIDGLVNAGLMSAFGFEDHHHGDAESISGMHDDDLHPQGSLDMLMMHRNSLFVLDSIMRGKGHTVPQEFMDMHNNSDLTQALGDIPPHAHIAANLEGMYNNLNYLGQKIGPQMNEPNDDWQNKLASKPMANAWSTLMKRETPSTMSARRRREKRQEFRPSTGQFKTPPGGMSGGAGATMRRFKGQMRGIKGSKKTGLMKPHLSVEMSHRGIATKQPMSKDPQKYGQYMGQSEARKRLGNVRTVFSPHARHSARSFNAGPTGAGRLSGLMPGQQGLMSRPSLQRMRAPRLPRMPRVRRPPMPMAPQMAPPMSSVPSMPAPSSSMMMSEDRTESDFLKSNRHAGRTEYLKLMRELMRLQRERLNKAGTASAFEEGAVPAHPAGVHQHEDEDEKNDGPTQNLETNSSRMGLDPAGYLVSRRGHMG